MQLSRGGNGSTDGRRRLQSIVDAGLTTPLAIGIATGLSENEIVSPTEEQRNRLDALLKNYQLATKRVNIRTLRNRLLTNGPQMEGSS